MPEQEIEGWQRYLQNFSDRSPAKRERSITYSVSNAAFAQAVAHRGSAHRPGFGRKSRTTRSSRDRQKPALSMDRRIVASEDPPDFGAKRSYGHHLAHGRKLERVVRSACLRCTCRSFENTRTDRNFRNRLPRLLYRRRDRCAQRHLGARRKRCGFLSFIEIDLQAFVPIGVTQAGIGRLETAPSRDSRVASLR